MFKNIASQKIQVFAFDATTSVPKTGDAANITAYVSKDHGAVTVLGDTSATEMDATNAPGVYVFDLTQGETNGDELTFSAKSSTANIKIVPRFISTNPPLFTTFAVDASGRIDIGKLLGTAWLTPGTAGTPDVNVKLWNALTTVALPVAPTVAGRTLDISAGGEAGVDWANVGSPTTAVGLSGTTISTTQVVASVSGAVGSVTGAVGSVTGAVGSVTGNVGGNVVGTVASVVGAVGSVTGLTASNLDATVSSRLATSGYTAPPTAAQNATAVFTTQLTESYAALHAAPTLAQISFEMRSLLAEKSVAVTTLTAKKIDGSTTAGTYTLNDAVAPTAITKAT